MAPDDRRAALITATVPLLHECGLEVSTRQIAQAAGVAEGTIFGVFPDKGSLVVAALMHALDPRPTVQAIEAIDPAAPLRDRLARAATLVNERFASNAHLLAGARKLLFASDSHPDAAAKMARGRERLHSAIAALIEPDATLLRRSPGTVARLLLLFCGANSFGPFGDPAGFDGDEMVSLLLDGLLVTPGADHGGDDRC
ncbi:TetR/AcrR family transcriptional regulator [Couchioplanes azureus]|uniref:TetR/AcrR family transcriptional regulator n=1 Tax=Couchioplanes caeruleus TaxID=56438 RepID=UPI0016718124|nr:TetR/AcrR family transcriptional regulator [Couchioplanes caeruleus]